MKFTTATTALSLITLTSAHFVVEYPYWRGDSFEGDASQWTFPCANVNETTDLSNRTQWPTTGGSIKLEVHHPWALTYVNLGLGTNVSAFNISLVNNFNQTGNGTFCLKETGKKALEDGLKVAGLNASSVDGKQASLQIIQIASTGASLFNCADITFNATAALLSDDECKNSTGVAGVAIQNANVNANSTETAPPATSSSPGAAANVRPVVGGSVLAGLVGLVAAML